MKGGMVRKLLILYLLIISILFLLVNAIGPGIAKKKTTANYEKNLYETTEIIAQNYVEPYYEDRISLLELKKALSSFAQDMDLQILMVSNDGKPVWASFDVSESKLSQEFFENDFFSQPFHKNFTNSLTNRPKLVVGLPITYLYITRGYVCVMQDMSLLEADVNNQINTLNMYYLVGIAALFASFVGVYFLLVRPVKKSIKIAKEFSEGNIDKNLKITTNDEFKELSDLLEYMGDTVNRFDEYQRKIIANISHDFRSPLTSIKGYAEAIQDGTIPQDQQGKYLDVILFEVERLTKLTQNLLTLNTFDKNGMMLQRTNYELNAVVKNVAQVFEGTCKQKKITLRLLFSHETVFVNADRGRIEQVIYNLVDNAIKFSHADSEIRIFTEKKGRKVIVSIQDEGAGIQKTELMKIWDRFYKSDSSRGKDKKGTGLGLSIVKEIITAHNENINVISTVGVGTEFIFTLPLATADGNAAEDTAKEQTSDADKKEAPVLESMRERANALSTAVSKAEKNSGEKSEAKSEAKSEEAPKDKAGEKSEKMSGQQDLQKKSVANQSGNKDAKTTGKKGKSGGNKSNKRK